MVDFYLDSNIAHGVVHYLSVAGHDVVTAQELQFAHALDDQQLLEAAELQRILVTHNESDFTLLHDAWHRWSNSWHVPAKHAGIMIVPQGPRYGREWDAPRISEAIIACLRQCGPTISNDLFRRRAAGWERRDGRDWIPCSNSF